MPRASRSSFPRGLLVVAVIVLLGIALAAFAGFRGGYLDGLLGDSDISPSPANGEAAVTTPTPTPAPAQETPTPTSTPTPEPAPTEEPEAESQFAAPEFEALWARTDLPVVEEQIDRPLVWGEAPVTDAIFERWDDAPVTQRLAQYFAKGRMEIIDLDGDASDPWRVTPGLLVLEMVEGAVRLGPEIVEDPGRDADFPIGIEGIEDGLPTYEEIATLGLPALQPHVGTGAVISQTISEDLVISDPSYADYQVTAAVFNDIPGRAHMIASVFWDYVTDEDVIVDDDEYVAGPLFVSTFYAIGFPITEPYWATVTTDEGAVDVLWQCFERRCLLYFPDDEGNGWIESGDVGLHYYQWRYGAPPPGES